MQIRNFDSQKGRERGASQKKGKQALNTMLGMLCCHLPANILEVGEEHMTKFLSGTLTKKKNAGATSLLIPVQLQDQVCASGCTDLQV